MVLKYSINSVRGEKKAGRSYSTRHKASIGKQQTRSGVEINQTSPALADFNVSVPSIVPIPGESGISNNEKRHSLKARKHSTKKKTANRNK